MNSSDELPKPSSTSLDDVVIRSVELLRPEPGDVVLITMPDNCKPSHRHAVAKSFQDACGKNVRVACLPHTFGVRVVRAADIPSEAYPQPESPIVKPGESTML